MRPWSLKAGSAEEVTLGLISPERRPQLNDGALAWIWTAIRVLWERWFPESPCYEVLDARISAGYNNAATPQGAEEWLAGYEILKKLGDKLQVHTLRELDRRFVGTELLQNWVQDLEMALGDLARPSNHQECRIA